MSDRGRGVFVVGLAAGAAATLLLATRQGRGLCRRLIGGGGPPAPDRLVETEATVWSGEDPDARSEELRRKIEETRRRLREQVGLPPEE